MRHHTVTEHVRVPILVAWQVLSDVRAWPEWTQTMESVDLEVGTHLVVGARVRIRQPHLRPATWTVTSCTPGCDFTWESRYPGVRVRAMHRLDPTSDGCTLRQDVHFEGLLGGLVARRLGRLTREYMQEEAEGFRRRCVLLHARGQTAAIAEREFA
ncbi:hypothetical protein LYSHEL_21910 [Lysobacter helvus]|uniref:Polyketide cyclase n=2 Tax=Lysobacteraceae TaxID=32033 RepID=A0ABN6FU06_9GAMM|nr:MULTISPECIES: SRPBCC family protein [Lysobacter]BCT93168.1 hypothetical protein LYSCAS_21920 [Lysobacter caseinilyticus]BCT96320.1 hypothetical protein LYSHEL_21910 [Lysobacter helvus]